MNTKQSGIILACLCLAAALAAFSAQSFAHPSRDRGGPSAPARVDVRAFGAAGDGDTDDGDAIRKAIEYAADRPNAILYFPPAKGYAVTGTVEVPNSLNVEMDAPLVYTGNSDEPCLVIGRPGAAIDHKRLRVDVVRRKLSGWSDEGNVGVRIYNANTCDIQVDQASRFTIGVQCMGDRGGFSYNEVRLFYIMTNHIGLDLNNDHGGWTNENTFYGGRFGGDSGANTSMSRYGVRITSKSGYYNNANLFIRPSFELMQKKIRGEALPVLAEYADYNRFVSCRDEANGKVFARVSNKSQNNLFDTGYGGNTAVIEEKGDYPSSIFTNRRQAVLQFTNQIFNSGPLQAKACYYDGNSKVNVADLHVAQASGPAALQAGAGITPCKDCIEISPKAGVGIFINTNGARAFVVKRDVDKERPGRVAVRCYDEKDRVLGDGRFVRGLSNMEFFYSPAFGGVYTCSDSDSDAFFSVAPQVRKIAVIITGGKGGCRLRQFSVFTRDLGGMAAYPGCGECVPGANCAVSPPAAGAWQTGKVVYNAKPAPGAYAGWICVAGGTPGTWKGFGAIAR